MCAAKHAYLCGRNAKSGMSAAMYEAIKGHIASSTRHVEPDRYRYHMAVSKSCLKRTRV